MRPCAVLRTDVRSQLAAARTRLGAAEDPIAALRASGYLQRMSAERGSGDAVVGGWAR
jgi:L-rhamnose isomerase / sugar isomerase